MNNIYQKYDIGENKCNYILLSLSIGCFYDYLYNIKHSNG